MRSLLHYLIGIFLSLAFAASEARASDLVLERAYVDDSRASFSLADAKSQNATIYTGVLSRGFTRSATWIRLRIAAASALGPNSQLVVRVRPVYLDQIELFDPLDDSGQRRVTGDRYDWRRSEIESLNHGFIIPASDVPRELWLRIRTESSSQIHIEVMPLEQARQVNRFQEIVYGLMMGALVLFFLWAVVQWLLRREALMAAFALVQMTAIIYAASYVGYHRVMLAGMLDGPSIDLFSCFVFCTYTAAAFVFHYYLLREFNPARWALWTLGALAALSFIIDIALIEMGHIMAAMRNNIIMVSMAPLLLLMIAVTCKPGEKSPLNETLPIPKSLLVGFYAVVIAALLIATLPTLGLSRAPEINLHMYLIHGVMTGVVLTVLLQVRATRIERSRNLAYLREQSASQQIEIERQKSQLQGRFMEMLVHELKTSLGVLHMVFGSTSPSAEMKDHGRRTVESINALIERCLAAEKFSDDEIIAHFDRFELRLLIEEVTAKTTHQARIALAAEEPVVVFTDRRIFGAVLSNLIDNALKYSPPDSMVRVHIRSANSGPRAGCEVVIDNEVDVSQGAPGFPDASQLFKKYYRAEGARKYSGSGLGLYLVANFTRLLGGTVNYEPVDTHVRFTVWLPV